MAALNAREYTTELHLAGFGAVLGAIAGFVVGFTDLDDGPWWIAIPAWTFGTSAFTSALVWTIGWQRAVLDPDAGILGYRNLSSLYRWRTIRLPDVERVKLAGFSDTTSPMVSSLQIFMRPEKGGYMQPDKDGQVYVLTDTGLGSFRGPSQLMREVAHAVSDANPRAQIDPRLLR